MRWSIALAVLFVSAPASAAVTFRGGFETGDLSQWGEKLNAHRISVVDTPVLEGKKAGRFEIRKGDTALANMLVRVELGHHPAGKMEGTEGYYAWSAMPSTDKPFVVGSHQITYWECDKIYKQVMSFHVDGEKVSLHTRVPTSKQVWSGSFTKGKWHNFVLHVKWSPDPTVGFVELWYEGAKVLDKTMVATQHTDAGAALNNFIHQGIFRGADTISEVEVMYLDGTIAGTTYDDVAPPPPVMDAGAMDAVVEDTATSDAAVEDTATSDAVVADTAVTPTEDGAVETDAAPVAGSEDAAGCGCRTARSETKFGWVALIALALLRRRR